MVVPPLSTTALIGQLKSGQFREFVDKVEEHFHADDSDSLSALKVIKTVAAFVYEQEIPEEFVGGVVKSVETCEEIISKESKPDVFLKELFGNISHLMSRLVKQEHQHSIPALASIFIRIHSRVVNKEIMNNMVHNLYVLLWNMAYKLEPSTSSETGIVGLINIQFSALEMYTLLYKSDRFTMSKLLDKLMSTARLMVKKNAEKTVCNLLQRKLLLVISNPVMEQVTHKWELCCFMIELFSKEKERLEMLLTEFQQVLGTIYTAELAYLRFATALRWEGVVHEVTEISINPSSTPALLPLVDTLTSSSLSSLSPELLPVGASTLMMLTKMATPSTALVAMRILGSLLTSLLAALKAATSPQLVNMSTSLVSDYSNCLKLLPSTTESRQLKNCVSSLSISSFNLAVVLYNQKLFSQCRSLLEESCRSCNAWAKLDQQRAASLRPRLKLLAEVLFKMGQFKECLRMFSSSLVVLLNHEPESVQNEKLSEACRFWIGIKREWLVAEPDNTEVHEVNMISLLQEDPVFGMEAANPDVVTRLGRQETTWYRQGYLPGCDLTQSWVSSAGRLLKYSNTEVDRGMVLLEQTWVFWLGDNHEDLEMGVKCAEKALVVLAGQQLCGLAWYWRFMCEHRLLMLQVQEAMSKAGEERMMGRMEKEGIGVGEEQEEVEPTPAYPGLEMSAQIKLVGFLEQALNIWEEKEFIPSDWMGGKVMLQFMLALAWELERMGHSGVRAFILVQSLGKKLGEKEEMILAMVEIVRRGDRCDMLGELAREGTDLETKKANSWIACQVGLAVAHTAMVRGERDIAREVLGEMIVNPVVKQNSLKCNLVGAESRLSGSLLRLQMGEWVSAAGLGEGLSQLGPLELALDAWKLAVLCYKWWEQDVRLPSSQDPILLWLGPRLATLQLQCVEQLSTLFRMISSPRELKCYLKEGLKVAQLQCLPLQTANLLCSLAGAHLLCDDEAAATVQVDGVLFVLHCVLGDKSVKTKNMESDDSEVVKLPGQDDRSMSPALVKHYHTPPPFLEHPPSCTCLPCTLPLLHRVLLGTMFSQAWGLAVAGQEDISTLSTMMVTMFTTFKQKSKALADRCQTSESIIVQNLSKAFLNCLVQEVEIMAWQGNWERGLQIIKMIKDITDTMSYQWLSAHPALLVAYLELSSSIKDAMEKEATTEKVKKAAAEEALTKKFQSLDIEETCSSLTPTAGQPSSRSIGAPHKRLIPSLGVGNPDTLVKSLEETLNLVTDDTDEQEQEPKMKAVRRGGGRPRLFSAADLTANIKRVVPKLVLKEGTPRKFFKSKEVVSEIPNTPGDHQPPSTPGLKPQAKITKSESSVKVSAVKSSSRSSLKENVYEIFEDQLTTPVQSEKPSSKKSTRKLKGEDSFKTPAPSTSTRTSTRKTSARKASLADACDESLVVTKSVSKPPRMAKLVEEAPAATRTLTRRKAALKRL